MFRHNVLMNGDFCANFIASTPTLWHIASRDMRFSHNGAVEDISDIVLYCLHLQYPHSKKKM
jgi:cytochrome c peroxidase